MKEWRTVKTSILKSPNFVKKFKETEDMRVNISCYYAISDSTYLNKYVIINYYYSNTKLCSTKHFLEKTFITQKKVDQNPFRTFWIIVQTIKQTTEELRKKHEQKQQQQSVQYILHTRESNTIHNLSMC